MKDTYIVLIVGKSGSGKSTLAKVLEENYGLKEVKSYTTRLCRGDEDTSHIFVTKEEFKRLDLCAYTLYNGNEYGATNEQVDNADIYVIDPNGVEYFLESYHGKKIPMMIYIDADKRVRRRRLKARGDNPRIVKERLDNDDLIFKGIEEYAFRTFVNNGDGYDRVHKIANEIYNMFFRETDKGE